MKFYSVHYRSEHEGRLEALADHLRLVKQGFSWPAFLAGPFWLVAKGMWIVLAGVIGLICLLVALLAFHLVSPDVFMTLWFGTALLLGFEGNDLYRWTLSRKRLHQHGFVAGKDRETAEQRFFAALDQSLRQQVIQAGTT